jgi:RimJ/RimL family protein N-acetyltransferase
MENDQTEAELIINGPISRTIERYPSGESCTLLSVDQTYAQTDQDQKNIAKLFNQPSIYKLFLAETWKGREFSAEDARTFIGNAQKNWISKKSFIFLVRNPENDIVAVLTIKSPNLDSAEIGFWASENYPGIMTNALIELCDIAQRAGYKQLFGKTMADNEKSLRVLNRAGFNEEKPIEQRGLIWVGRYKKI